MCRQTIQLSNIGLSAVGVQRAAALEIAAAPIKSIIDPIKVAHYTKLI
jgi:hypothetical protein